MRAATVAKLRRTRVKNWPRQWYRLFQEVSKIPHLNQPVWELIYQKEFLKAKHKLVEQVKKLSELKSERL